MLNPGACRVAVRRRSVKHFFTTRCKDWEFFKDKPPALMDELAKNATLTSRGADEEVYVEKVRVTWG